MCTDALGVELELEGFTSDDLHKATRHLAPLWRVTADGSLRNGGVEFVTNGGLGGERLHAAFERIVNLLQREVDYDATFRCSTHMHINMCDFTVQQVAKFLMVYAACEPLLFTFCGPYRRSSNFCVPVGDSLPFHRKLISDLYDTVVAERGAARSTCKYTALNLQPLFGSDRVRPIGTVEFRGGRPLTTMADFITQANLLLSIKNYVRVGPEDPEELVRSMGDNVINTVYANGCASSIMDWKVEEMETGMINAWCLLKAYQEGMKRPRKKAQAFEAGIADWTGATISSRDALQRSASRAAPREIFWNAAHHLFQNSGQYGNTSPNHTITNYGPGNNPLGESGWPRFNQYIDGLVRNEQDNKQSMFEYIRLITSDPALDRRGSGHHDGRLTSGEIEALIAAWQLIGDDVSIVPAMIESVLQRITHGRKNCLIYGNRPSEQLTFRPRTAAERVKMDWRRRLSRPQQDRLMTLYGMSQWCDCYSIFGQMVRSKVDIDNVEQLQEHLNAAVENTPQLPIRMRSTTLWQVLRITQQPSNAYLSGEDLMIYDLVSETMEILFAAGCAVPVVNFNNNMIDSRCARDSYRTLEGTQSRHLPAEGRTPRPSTYPVGSRAAAGTPVY